MPTGDPIKIKKKVRELPPKPGVYLMKDRFGSVLYIGKAKNLKKRVSTYFQPSRKFRLQQPKVVAMIDLIEDFEYLTVSSDAEAILLEGRLIKEWKPKYNTDFTDDKRFLMVRVDLHEALPRFRLVRFRSDDRARYFGPFAHSGLLRQTLAQMRKEFGILLADASPKRLGEGRWLLYEDIRAEIYEHPAEVTESEYASRVERALIFLEGKSREWLYSLRTDMARASENQQYEKAAQLRDVIQALEKTLKPERRFTRAQLPVSQAEKGLDRLQEVLGLREHPNHMECFDISHISGSFCVASMVRFQEGRPVNGLYRRYRIKSFIGNDDFRAMREVVARRYGRLVREGKALPDVIVIDGGEGQVAAALKAFVDAEVMPPELIGLAKKEERIVFADARESLVLARNDAGLQLLQRIRDEAHRFANQYNADLRSRRIRESVLDELPGLGAKKKELLLHHFKTVGRLKSATVDELSEVSGIGPIFARRIHDFFKGGNAD